MNYAPPEGLDTRRTGETFTYATLEQKEQLEADPKIQQWLEQVGREAEALSKASDDFRASLRTSDKDTSEAGLFSVEVDLAPKLEELRRKWIRLSNAPISFDKQALLAELATVIKSWLDKVAAEKAAMEAKIKAAGLDLAKLPSGDQLKALAVATQDSAKAMKTLLEKLGAHLKRGQRAQVDKLVAKAGALLEVGQLAPATPQAHAPLAEGEFTPAIPQSRAPLAN